MFNHLITSAKKEQTPEINNDNANNDSNSKVNDTEVEESKEESKEDIQEDKMLATNSRNDNKGDKELVTR